MEQMADFPQLQLHFVDHIQWRYEVIRPIVLFQDRTATQRAEETHTHPETVRKLTRRFRQQGIFGLLPDHTDIVVPSWGRHVPAAVVEEMARLKALYDGFQYRELARIIFYKLDYRIDDKTVKKLWQQSPVPVQGELPFGAYHSHAERTQARLQVIKLYYQGWSKRSISHFLRVSRPTVDRWIHRFEAEHVAGLADKSRAPKAPTRKVWLPLMLQIYHLQKRHPDAGEFRIWSLLAQRHDFRADGGTRDGLKPAGLPCHSPCQSQRTEAAPATPPLQSHLPASILVHRWTPDGFRLGWGQMVEPHHARRLLPHHAGWGPGPSGSQLGGPDGPLYRLPPSWRPNSFDFRQRGSLYLQCLRSRL